MTNDGVNPTFSGVDEITEYCAYSLSFPLNKTASEVYSSAAGNW